MSTIYRDRTDFILTTSDRLSLPYNLCQSKSWIPHAGRQWTGTDGETPDNISARPPCSRMTMVLSKSTCYLRHILIAAEHIQKRGMVGQELSHAQP